MPGLLVLAFGVVLMVAVLLSERANRTVLSTAVIFLGAGFVLGQGGAGLVSIEPHDEVILTFAELALFTILFVDGARLPRGELTRAWHLPGRALLLGIPLTIGGIALAGRFLLDMTWTEAFLVGAILSPTDPVLVAAILEHEAVPLRLRRLLGVESGLNDGLVLPVVVVMLSLAGHREVHLARALLEAGAGAAIGVVVPAVFLWLEGRHVFAASRAYRPLGGVAIAATLFGLCRLAPANELLAAFAGGITLATMRPELASALRDLGRPLAEALKLATLLVFGAILSAPLLVAPGFAGLLFATIALVAARPAALVLALLGGGLPRREWLAAAWSGPKGFASLLYSLLLLHAGLAHGERLFQALALVIVLSIVAHSSTDVAVARVFRRAEEEARAAEEETPDDTARAQSRR